jgi:small-conductance mechanosensitive channel/CRP-like cAMP-binding protein
MMDVFYRLILVLLIVVSAIFLLWIAKANRLPRPPLKLTLFAAFSWFILHGFRFAGAHAYFNAADELIISAAVVRYLNWLIIECFPIFFKLKPAPNVVRDLIFWLVYGVVFVIEVKAFGGFDLASLLTTSAVLTAVFGLALQGSLKDFFAGIEIQIDPPFRKGDWIKLGDLGGIVKEMNLMDTSIRVLDNSIVSIPNGKVTEDRVIIFAAGAPVGNDFSVSLDYQLPPGQAIEFLMAILRGNPKVLQTPKPRVWLGSYDDSSIRYDILVFQDEVDLSARNSLKSELLSQIWYALDREGRSFPYPVMELSRWQPIPAPSDPASLLLQDKISHIQNGWLFKTLDAHQLECLARNVRFLRFGPGEMIVNQGDQGSTLYQLIRGQVEVLVSAAGRPFVSVAMLGEDAILGEMSLLTGEPRSASLRAVGECLLLEVERRDMQPIFQGEPGLLEELAELIADRRAALEKLSTVEADDREKGILAMMRKLFG